MRNRIVVDNCGVLAFDRISIDTITLALLNGSRMSAGMRRE
jgi:hypothetical protein